MRKKIITEFDNYNHEGADLKSAIIDKDIFIGVSKANILTTKMIRSMADTPIVFALANPNPEISYDLTKEAGVAVLATGRSDYPNQVNNVLVFPGIFRGMIDNQVKQITIDHKINAAKSLAELVDRPSAKQILPDPFEPNIANIIADAII